jgi:hypothetical protein
MPKPKDDNGQLIFETSLMVYFHNQYNVLLKWLDIQKILNYIDLKGNNHYKTGLQKCLLQNYGLELLMIEIHIIVTQIKLFFLQYAETNR